MENESHLTLTMLVCNVAIDGILPIGETEGYSKGTCLWPCQEVVRPQGHPFPEKGRWECLKELGVASNLESPRDLQLSPAELLWWEGNWPRCCPQRQNISFLSPPHPGHGAAGGEGSEQCKGALEPWGCCAKGPGVCGLRDTPERLVLIYGGT